MRRDLMTEAYAQEGYRPNLGGAETCTDNAVSCTISEVFRAKYPMKTWSVVASMFGLQERTAKHRLAGTRVYTVGELQHLLRSEDGLDFLVAVMGDAQPAWWRWALKVMSLASVRRRQAEDQQLIMSLESGAGEPSARRRIKGAMDANGRVSAALARAETALGFQDPNLDRMGGARDGGVAGVSGRAVAQARPAGARR